MAVGETQASACKRLRTSLYEFEDDDQVPAVPVDELVMNMSLRLSPVAPESKMNLLH